MDVNGTRFQLLLTQEDWANCIDVDEARDAGANGTRFRLQKLSQSWQSSCSEKGTTWDAQHAGLTLRALPFQFPAPVRGYPLPPESRRGAGRDHFGRWYWIADTETELCIQRGDLAQPEHFWSADDEVKREARTDRGDFQPVADTPAPQLLRMSGLTITEDAYLVVGVLEPAGLLIFDLYTTEPPLQLLWPPHVPFVPFDMAARPGGGVWILDRQHVCYWALDRYFNVQREEQPEVAITPAHIDIFQPVNAEPTRQTPARTFPEGISLNTASPLAASDPVAIEALPDETVLILDSNSGEQFSRIYHYRFGQQLGEPISLAATMPRVAPDSLIGHDFVFVPADKNDAHLAGQQVPGRIYIVNGTGKQCYAFTLSLRNGQLAFQVEPAYFPQHRYGGRGLVAVGQAVFYDMNGRWFPLVEQPRPLYVTTATIWTPLASLPDLQPVVVDGSVMSRSAFDGHMPDCVWHRLFLDACIPPETSIEVWSRAADREDALIDATWQQEPALYMRSDGSELPFAPAVNGGRGAGTWELLFQAARGRYLQLQFILRGNGRITPRIQAVRIYYPRFSYLDHYLPAVYREDADSASFVERFLANVEGFYTTLEDKMDAVHMLFDVRSAPPETLDWLASWFGIALERSWNERKKRLFLRHAMEFFQWRGTMRGLLMALRLALEEHPSEAIFTHRHSVRPPGGGISIVERFRERRTLPVPSTDAGDGDVFSRSSPVDQEARWSPAQGGAQLDALYREYLRQHGWRERHGDGSKFPLLAPRDAMLNAVWQQFARDMLGFVPSATWGDLPDLRIWQNFLLQRYGEIDALNDAYQAQHVSFGKIPLLQHLPQGDLPCNDWYQFEGFVLPVYHAAHQFTVLLPAPGGGNAAGEAQQLRDLARRVLEMEKPA
ncbi:MAG TPA: phage tail protein, partial [Ktedonobacteraceae bacterium]|nr:phage tail protein [Ktedonobacteraceae bacterium]